MACSRTWSEIWKCLAVTLTFIVSSPDQRRPNGPRSEFFPVACGQDSHFLAVLGDGSPRYDQPLLAEKLDDLLIRQRMLALLLVDELLDPIHRHLRGDRVSRLGIETAGEEVLQWKDSARRLHVLVRGDTAHR